MDDCETLRLFNTFTFTIVQHSFDNAKTRALFVSRAVCEMLQVTCDLTLFRKRHLSQRFNVAKRFPTSCLSLECSVHKQHVHFPSNTSFHMPTRAFDSEVAVLHVF